MIESAEEDKIIPSLQMGQSEFGKYKNLGSENHKSEIDNKRDCLRRFYWW